MPLALDYSFVDTDREVLVTLPLKVAPGAVHVDGERAMRGADQRAVAAAARRQQSGTLLRVAVTRCSLKVNQTPYLLQLDLHGDVEWEAAATTVDAATRQVRVVLKKVVKGRWPAIRFSGPADAAAARRAAAEEEAAKRSAEVCCSSARGRSFEVVRERFACSHATPGPMQLSAARQSTKAKLERAAVTAQLVVDEDARRTMDRAKAEMHTAAEVREEKGVDGQQVGAWQRLPALLVLPPTRYDVRHPIPPRAAGRSVCDVPGTGKRRGGTVGNGTSYTSRCCCCGVCHRVCEHDDVCCGHHHSINIKITTVVIACTCSDCSECPAEAVGPVC